MVFRYWKNDEDHHNHHNHGGYGSKPREQHGCYGRKPTEQLEGYGRKPVERPVTRKPVEQERNPPIMFLNFYQRKVFQSYLINNPS